MTNSRPIVIYGAGSATEALLARHGQEWADIIVVTTSGEGTFRGQPVMAARELLRLGDCSIIVASSFRRQILDVLEQLGIPDSKVEWYLHQENKIVSTSELRILLTRPHDDYQLLMERNEIELNFRDMESEFFQYWTP